MKILFTVELYEPNKGGAQEVVRQLAERLVRRGHAVTIATTFLANRTFDVLHGVRIEQFKLAGNSVRGIVGEDAEVRRYQDLLCGDFDVVVNYAAQTWATDLVFPVLDGIHAKKVLVPCGYSGLHSQVYQDYFAALPMYLKKYDSLVYLSCCYQDKLFGDTHGLSGRGVVIPNAAATEEFLPADTFDVRKKLNIDTKYLLLDVSTHYRDKGHGFVIEAFLRMHRNDATLLIVGEHPGATLVGRTKQLIRGCYKNCFLQSKLHANIRLVGGTNRDLIVSAYKSADLFLFGSKVECAPLVLYEAFASKTPFVSTAVGNVGDYADIVRIVQTPEEMSIAANDLLDDEKERIAVAGKGFTLWKDRHTWDVIVDKYEQLFITLTTI